MCLAVPMKVLEVSGARAVVDLGGVRRTVSLDLMEDVRVGDYVIVHAGFAIEKLDEQEANARLELFQELAAMQSAAPPRTG